MPTYCCRRRCSALCLSSCVIPRCCSVCVCAVGVCVCCVCVCACVGPRRAPPPLSASIFEDCPRVASARTLWAPLFMRGVVCESAPPQLATVVRAARFEPARATPTHLFGWQVEVLWSCFACAKPHHTTANQRDDGNSLPLTRDSRAVFPHRPRCVRISSAFLRFVQNIVRVTFSRCVLGLRPKADCSLVQVARYNGTTRHAADRERAKFSTTTTRQRRTHLHALTRHPGQPATVSLRVCLFLRPPCVCEPCPVLLVSHYARSCE